MGDLRKTNSRAGKLLLPKTQGWEYSLRVRGCKTVPPPLLSRRAMKRTKKPKNDTGRRRRNHPITTGSWFSEGKDSCNYNSGFWNKEFPWRKSDYSYKHLCPSRERSSPLCQALPPRSKASSVSGRCNRSLKGL